MSKHKSSPSQSTFFRRPIPQMPEGYYSSGPNPNLRRFVEEHATPYDPDTDNYKVKPFDKPITTTKATAIYNMHTYWSKKPHDAIREYIKHYTKPGDIGGTALAALMEGRAAIAIDLSPAATFITKNYCTPVDVDELQRAFEELQRKVKPEMDWLYETRCDRCDGRASISYTILSQTYQCSRCLTKTTLFDCVEVVIRKNDEGESKTIRVCPNCYARDIAEEISTKGESYGSVPVAVSYECLEGCKPTRSLRLHNDSNPKKKELFQELDLEKIKAVSSRDIPYWYPDAELSEVIPFRMLVKQDFRPTDAKRLVDFYTRQNLWALALLREKIETEFSGDVRDALLFCWSSITLNVSRMTTNRDRLGYLKGTYYIPSIHRCTNVWGTFKNKFRMMGSGWRSLSEITNTNLLISTESSTNLQKIPDNSIDYIFTDPPYAGNVQYGELNYFWEAWLGFNTDWRRDEIIVNKMADKSDEDWATLMRNAMEECYRVLKPGRWISLTYHDTSEGTWQLLQDLMAEIGFITENSSETLFIDTGQKTYNQKMADKVTKRDLVINFRKPYPGELTGQLSLFDASDFATFQEAARLVLVEALTNHPGSTADRLYDELVSRLVRKGQFERHDFDELLLSVAEPVREPRMANLFEKEQPNLFGTHEVVRWYLKATVDVVDEAESAKETSAARRLETFMARYLAKNPEEAGVHYSDLFEQYLPIKDKPRRLLQEWLPEFFFKTAEGTWRPPANESERAELAALRSSGLLRRVKRFGNALLQGVPPAEHDKPESAATLADWVRQCRRAGLYEIGRVLYEKSGIKFDGLNEVALVELEEDYQVCVRRSEVKPVTKKKSQQSVFDEINE
jgi:hypothetical protein